jgi:CubicO group peptidase (beta-lactamase class C family)
MLWLALASFAIAFAADPLPSARPEDVGMSSQQLGRIATVLNKEVADGSFRGAVVMVARKGRLVYHGAFGMQTPSAKMTEDSIFRIYSMTKPLVSVAAMMLVEDGTIQLTDPVSKFLPAFGKLQVSVAGKDSSGNATYSLVAAERPMTVQDCCGTARGLRTEKSRRNRQ